MNVYALAEMGKLAFDWIQKIREAGRDEMTPEELVQYEAEAKARRQASWERFEAAQPKP